MAVKDMQSILGYIKQRGLFQGITRFQYLKYNMEDSLEIVTAIGKSRNPAFVIDDENRFTYENMIRWCHCDTKMQAIDPVTKKVIPGGLKKGIYIAGNTGTGKSWCLEVMAAYAMAFGFVITLGETEKRMLYWENVRADDICEEYAANGTFQKFKTRNIYGIQDLGSEPAESVYMGNRIEVLRQLLEYRGDRTDQVTLFTSNLPMNHKILVDRYGDRVSSRLSAMCNYFEIRGKDRRKM
jgi:DNA replication protein DnaC